MKNQQFLGTLIAILGGVCWGLSGACGQFLFQNYDVSSSWLVPVRLFTAGLVLTVFFVIKDGKKTFKVWESPRSAARLVAYGLVGLMLCQYSYFLLIEISNAGTATVLQYVAPVMIMSYVCVSERKRPRAYELAALVLALAGVFLLATHGKPATLAVSWKVVALGLLSALTVAIYTLLPRKLMEKYPAPMLLGWAMIIGGVALGIIMRSWRFSVSLDAAGWLAVGVIILLGSVFGFALYMVAVKLVGATRASLYASVEPITAELLAVLWLGTPVYAADIAAFIMIIATVVIITIGGRKSEVSG